MKWRAWYGGCRTSGFGGLLEAKFWTANASRVANWKFEGFFWVDPALVAWLVLGVLSPQSSQVLYQEP